MNRQNVTLSLPKSLLRKAKIFAAGKDQSLSALLRESLEEKVLEADGYQRAKRAQFRLLKKGFDLGTNGEITTVRETLHDRP
ncbi:hypothetical protein LCGC14_3035410 [marine sediment metagenome]|uniref:CopG family transcriptional regulator n=1 Tax=marine sediment metagenome TaxID=412755 RepID=A0A0F8ZH72_9ZZZZ